MIVDGTYTFEAPKRRVWGLLLDPAVIAHVMPGEAQLRRAGDHRYEGDVRVKVGFLAADFALSVRLTDVREPEHYVMDIAAEGRLGSTSGQAVVDLAEENGGTTMRYRADLDIGGRLRGVGGRLLGSLSRMMTRQGLDALNREVRRRLAQDR